MLFFKVFYCFCLSEGKRFCAGQGKLKTLHNPALCIMCKRYFQMFPISFGSVF
ncbi:Hypothetical protein EAG7_03067 [Klebsiella aerogenes]|nr:Hypothetical protein EAG7_03067 [Klebsiella aerogenes]CCG31552.1 hypothetical protein [Klebsiella aerogenes EA1509E]